MNRRTLRVMFAAAGFALWVLCAALLIRYDLVHQTFGLRTIIVVVVSGFFASMRLARAWFNEPRPE